ncbi:MAG: hypothetical protein CO042_03960 [Parcubacteria group bacterium CG_4_9_14_0_2_um_filter_41_8]|nr:MAG: hypothetical protein CO042_03960 [Parcubacteria group bacterium CG_4_9_14_0_2_um_filter_41_8]
MNSEFKDKIILITGGTGSIGSNLTEMILKHEPRQLRILSRNEGNQYEFLERLKHPKNLRILIGDIRDRDRIEYAFKNVDIVIHAAAMKQVPLCEYNPFEAIKTNIIGSQNIIDAAINNEVKKVLAVSTDKSVHPTSIMGVSKLMMEKIFTNANWSSPKGHTRFACVRFGNVAWSHGSVLPIWDKQAKEKGIISVTNPDMTRFIMSVNQASFFILRSIELMQLGEIFVPKMPSIRIGDLARLFLKKHYTAKDISINVEGSRIGDKIHEELVDDSDRAGYILENKDMYIFIPRSLELYNHQYNAPDYPGCKKISSIGNYSSNEHIDLEKIEQII